MDIVKFKATWNKSHCTQKKKFLNKLHLTWMHKGFNSDYWKNFDDMTAFNRNVILEKLLQGEKLHHYNKLNKDEKRILGKRNI